MIILGIIDIYLFRFYINLAKILFKYRKRRGETELLTIEKY